MSLRPISSFAIALVLLPASGRTQSTPPLVTDRPDQTESTSIVPVGFAQVELGALFSVSTAEANDIETLTVAPTLLRVGVLDWLEARIGFAGWVQTGVTAMGSSSTTSGLGSPDIGLKLRVIEGLGLSPSMAVLANVALPIGSDGVRAERADPGARLAFAHTIFDRVGLGYNLGVRAASSTNNGTTSTVAEGLYTIAAGVALTEKVGAFVEGFGTIRISEEASSSHLLDTGLTLLVRKNLQLDVSAGARYAGDAEDWFVGAGVSLRVPR